MVTCYVFSATVAFVRVARGYWLKTHGCVGLVPCSNCGSQIGQACLRPTGEPGAETHYVRRNEAVRVRRKSPVAILKPGTEVMIVENTEPEDDLKCTCEAAVNDPYARHLTSCPLA